MSREGEIDIPIGCDGDDCNRRRTITIGGETRKTTYFVHYELDLGSHGSDIHHDIDRWLESKGWSFDDVTEKDYCDWCTYKMKYGRPCSLELEFLGQTSLIENKEDTK